MSDDIRDVQSNGDKSKRAQMQKLHDGKFE